MPHRHVLLLLIVILILAGCQREDATVPTAPPPDEATSPVNGGMPAPAETAAPGGEETGEAAATATETPPPTETPVPTRTPTGPLTVCVGQEPASLYLYGPASSAASLIREVVFDGPIDTRGYDVQPVILEELPTLENGGARLETVFVHEGEYVLDVEGNVVRLRSGITVRPAGCFDDECAVTYERPESAEVEEAPAPVPEATTGAGESGAPPPSARPTLPPDAGLEMTQLQATFRLLPGLTWSDGEPLTAADSVFSYGLAQEAELPPRLRTGHQGLVPPRSLDPIIRTASYTATSELEVLWAGVPGYYDPHYRSNFFIPLPAHRLEGLSAAELLQADDSARLPLGWGPYVLTEWAPGEQIVAERNPNYFRAGEEFPYFDEIVFRFTAQDPAAYLDELVSGGCDIIAQYALHSDLDEYRALQPEGALVIDAVPGVVWEHLDFGINPVDSYAVRGDYFEDARVRQAAAFCLDREAIAAAAGMQGTTIPDAYIPAQHPLYEQAGLAEYSFDLERGRALLAEAGWEDRDGDGIVEAGGVTGVANGARMAVSLHVAPSERREAVAAQIAADLGQCGFSVTVAEPLDPGLFFATSDESPIFGRRFDLASFAWLSDSEPPCQLFLSREIPTSVSLWHGFNVSGYSNEAYDAACQRGLESAPGMDSYLDGHLEALRIFNAELPAVPLFQHLRVLVARPDIAGLEVDPTAQSELWNIESLAREE
ncbi:MAG: ABC transporter substrate-binding protein [Anaerolineae bacterium]|nr:ABC transporter substrate-binding protein [Anaerolineae bacterium]